MENNNNAHEQFIGVLEKFVHETFEILESHYKKDSITVEAHEKSGFLKYIKTRVPLTIEEGLKESIFPKQINLLLKLADLSNNQKAVALAHLTNILNMFFSSFDAALEIPEIIQRFEIAYDKVSQIEFSDKSKDIFLKSGYLSAILEGKLQYTIGYGKFNPNKDDVDSSIANVFVPFINGGETACNVVEEYIQSNDISEGVSTKLYEMISKNTAIKLISDTVQSLLELVRKSMFSQREPHSLGSNREEIQQNNINL